MSLIRPRRLLALILALVLLAVCPVSAQAAPPDWAPALEASAAYLTRTVPAPQVSSIGGEWAVVGLARGGRLTQTQREHYLQALDTALAEQQGVLSSRKHTEYARAVLALSALGEDPRSRGGYDLLAPLEDFDKTVRQGLNGAIFALIALDSGDYATAPGLRDAYLDHLLSAQLGDGGWALYGSQADPDLTAQALQALAPYREQHLEAVDRGVARLRSLLDAGAFTTCESYAQGMIALCALNRAEETQPLLAGLLSFRREDGGFAHLAGGKTDPMASEQALCALTALERTANGQSPLYSMAEPAPAQTAPGLYREAALLAALLIPLSLLGTGSFGGNP